MKDSSPPNSGSSQGLPVSAVSALSCRPIPPAHGQHLLGELGPFPGLCGAEPEVEDAAGITNDPTDKVDPISGPGRESVGSMGRKEGPGLPGPGPLSCGTGTAPCPPSAPRSPWFSVLQPQEVVPSWPGQSSLRKQVSSVLELTLCTGSTLGRAHLVASFPLIQELCGFWKMSWSVLKWVAHSQGEGKGSHQ